jgi:hypothetical protein
MFEYGSLWENGEVFVERVAVEFKPHRWMGTLSYTGRPYVADGGVYVLKLDDGTSEAIEIYSPRKTWNNGPLTIVAPFNPAKPAP